MLSCNSSFSSLFIFGLCGLSTHLLSTILHFKSAYCFSSKFLGHYSRTIFQSMNVILCDSTFFSMSTPFSFPLLLNLGFITIIMTTPYTHPQFVCSLSSPSHWNGNTADLVTRIPSASRAFYCAHWACFSLWQQTVRTSPGLVFISFHSQLTVSFSRKTHPHLSLKSSIHLELMTLPPLSLNKKIAKKNDLVPASTISSDAPASPSFHYSGTGTCVLLSSNKPFTSSLVPPVSHIHSSSCNHLLAPTASMSPSPSPNSI